MEFQQFCKIFKFSSYCNSNLFTMTPLMHTHSNAIFINKIKSTTLQLLVWSRWLTVINKNNCLSLLLYRLSCISIRGELSCRQNKIYMNSSFSLQFCLKISSFLLQRLHHSCIFYIYYMRLRWYVLVHWVHSNYCTIIGVLFK